MLMGGVAAATAMDARIAPPLMTREYDPRTVLLATGYTDIPRAILANGRRLCSRDVNRTDRVDPYGLSIANCTLCSRLP